MSTATTIAPGRVARRSGRVSTHTSSCRLDRVRCTELVREDRPNSRWIVFVGTVVTPHGIVGVMSFLASDERDESSTYLRFVHEGRAYSRILNGHAAITERSAAIAAGRLVRDVVAGRVQP